MDPLQLEVYIWMYFSNLIRQENITVSEVSWNFSDNVQGTLNISDFHITGFKTLTNKIENINATAEDEEGNNKVCIYLPADYLELTMDYVADIGIDDEIPIYGDGSFMIGITDIKFSICMIVNVNGRYVTDVNGQIVYRHKPVEFTGFWKNEEVSLILQGLLNIVHRFIAMWSAYEPERASCIFSPFISYALNIWFENENSTLQFDPTCLQKFFLDVEEANEIYGIEEQVLDKLTYKMEDVNNNLNTFAEENRATILTIMKHLTQIALRLL